MEQIGLNNPQFQRFYQTSQLLFEALRERSKIPSFNKSQHCKNRQQVCFNSHKWSLGQMIFVSFYSGDTM